MGILAVISVCAVSFRGVTQEAASLPAEGSAFTGGDGEFVKGEIIVKLDEGATQGDLTNLNRRNGAITEENLPSSRVNVVDLPGDLSVSEAVDRYEASPDVEYAEPDFLLQPAQAATPNDPGYDRMWGLDNRAQTGGVADADVDAPEAWSVTTGDPDNVVAVIDTGTDISHLDLRSNVWTNPDEVPGNLVDDDDNGYVDDVNGWDFFHDDASVYDPADGDKHGTHVSGTIAAEGNNGIGVTGVNWQAQVMPLKFLGPNTGSTSDAIAAIDYAVAENVKVSNNSWGGGGYSQALQEAIARADAAGHLFVAAAGNGGDDGVGDDNDTDPDYPASYSNSNIISVAATDDDDRLASFSNFGDVSVDLGAPGVGILSTIPANSYGTYSGTSMASPQVAGVAALIKSENPLFDDARIKAQILQYSEDKPSLAGKTATGGRLNAQASITQQPPPTAAPAPDRTDPTISSPKPDPGSRVRDRTPAIRAIVRDTGSDLTRNGIRLVLDGRNKTTFRYDGGTNRLSFVTRKLSFGRHSVRVTATDPAGNTAIRSWRFKVVR
ncbi:MAG: S8 family peptidase [Rubrobacteraceae bacterium]